MRDFSAEEIEGFKKQIETELMATGRVGIEKLLHYMEDSGFYKAPCSTQYHLACEGGLAKHSLNVLETARKLNETLFDDKIFDDCIVIAALLHDLGKMGDYEKPMYVENYLKSGKRSETKPYETNSQLWYVPHEIRSVAIAERFIELQECEEYAILYHNGMYGDLKYAYNGKERPLDMIIHWADMFASRVIEVEEEVSENGG